MTYTSFWKPIIDFLLASLILLITFPVWFCAGVFLFFANNGSIFFRQPRPGKNEKIFHVIKFKTMNDKKNDSGELLPDSDRLTLAGKIIRSLSIDELPQLVNILKGDMSLIGPRPWLVEYLPLYNDFQRKRHLVKPGITGWAQVNGRNLLGWEKRFEYDIYYVNNVSLWLDIKIMVLTLYNIVRAKGISGEGMATMQKFKGNK